MRAEAPDPKATDGGVVTLRLYEPIDRDGGIWGISAKEVTQVLDALPEDTTEIRMLINSPGGMIWEGLAILNALRAHPAKVVAVVEGIAASAASFIAAAADELLMMQNSQLFVHNAWGLSVGNSADMTKMAADLAHEDKNIASIYAAKAGGSVDTWLAAMATETWYSAEEAVEAGLADGIVKATSKNNSAASAKNRFDLSVFATKAPAALAAPQAPVASASGPVPNSKEVGMSDTLLDGLRKLYGLADDADEAAVLAASQAALSSLEELNEKAATPPPPPAASPTPPDGTVLVDATQFAALQAAATEGQQARAQQLSDRRMTLVNAAIADGRVAPAQRDSWVAKLAAEGESAESVLASLAKGLVPVAALGHAGDPDLAEDDAIFAALFGADQKVSG